MAISTSALRAVGVALVLVVLGLEKPVWARADEIAVTSPNGGDVLAAASPITVTWTSVLPSSVTVSFIKVGWGGGGVGYGVPNTGQYTFTLSNSFSCDPQANYYIQLDQHVSGNTIARGNSGTFKLACPVTVTKTVANTTGRRVAGAFRMRVQCEPGSQTFADIAAPGPGSYTRKVQVPPNSTVCTVQEIGMPLPPIGCTWLTTYPGGQQRAPGGSPVIVVNTLQCGPSSPGGPRP